MTGVIRIRRGGMERWMCMEHLRICGGSGHWLFIFPSVKYNNMWKKHFAGFL